MSFAKSPQGGQAIMNVVPPVQQNNGGVELSTEVRAFILKSFPLARKKEIKNSDALLESGLVDSLGVLDIVSFLERQFSITMEDEELVPENLQTIDRIASFIQRKTPSQTSGPK